MKVVILAGGLGTRLGKITETIPKPMVPVADKPFLQFLLDYLIKQGISEVILCVSYKWELIESFFGTSYKGLDISYSVEEDRLGTGGALKKVFEEFQLESAIILNGDTIFFADLALFKLQHDRNESLISIGVKPVDDTGRYGSLNIDNDRIVSFKEKGGVGPGYINAGIYLIDVKLFKAFDLPDVFSLEIDLIMPNINKISPLAVIFDTYFLDIGVPLDYERAQVEYVDW